MRRIALIAGLLTLLSAPLAASEGAKRDAAFRAGTAALTTAAVESTYEAPVSDAESGVLTGPLFETLSPIVLVSLGIVGLFWVRRHAASL